MDALEFVEKYTDYLNEIKSVIKPELYSVIEELEKVDPHDLVSPAAWFQIENDAKGMVWAIFVKKVKEFIFTANQTNSNNYKIL